MVGAAPIADEIRYKLGSRSGVIKRGVSVMMSESDLMEARSEARLILDLGDDEVAKIFFQQTMRRNLTRTVRHLDRLLQSGGDDRRLGESALERLGFGAQN